MVLFFTRFGVLVVLTGWLIYGNVLYYNKSDPKQCDNGFRTGMFLMILLGYFEMSKCCCMSLFVCVLLPYLVLIYRRAAQPRWMPAAPQFIKNLAKTRFANLTHKAQDMCPICMVDFKETDEITPLPCDEKHYFHRDCIKSWLEKNNICPLCKKEITKEALDE